MTVRKRVDPTGKTGGEELGEQKKKECLLFLQRMGVHTQHPPQGTLQGTPCPHWPPLALIQMYS